MTPITLDTLKTICGAPDDAQRFIPHLNKYMAAYDINTPLRMASFLANTAEESECFSKVLEESSGIEYNGRKDLGNVQLGDGPKYKGRGLIQITGRNAYREASMMLFKDTRLMAHPEILEQPEFAVQSACWYWWSRGLNSVMDVPLVHVWLVKVNGKMINLSTFQWAVEKINGGQNGYSTRLKYFNAAMTALQAPAQPSKVVEKTPEKTEEPDLQK